MTDEELKNIEQATSLLVENGFVIKNTDNFIREIGTNNLEDVINRLNVLEQNVNEGINIASFVGDITNSLNEIEELVNNDAYFKNSIGANDFANLLNNMRGKFTLHQNVLKAESILKDREENLKSVERRVLELKKNSEIDDITRTSETIKLSYALNHAKTAKKESEEFLAKQKELYTESLKSFDVVSYKNDLLNSINALDTSYRKLSLEPSAMEKLAKVIRDTRDKIVVFGFEAQKSQKEFSDLCNKFGLEKTNNKVMDKQVVEPVKVEEVKEEQVIDKIEKEQFTIKTYEDLAYEVKRLNPHVEISKDEEGLIDGIIYDNESKLILPKGFSYDKELGINNKVDDKTPYISVPVIKKELKNTVSEDAPVMDAPSEVNPVINEQNDNRKVKLGKKYRVKKVRRAVVAPYVKSVLGFSALGGVLAFCFGVGLSPVLPAAGIAAAVGAVGQAIYNKMALAGIVDKKNEDLRATDNTFEEDVWGLAAVDALVAKGKSLFASLKNARENRHAEPKPEKVEEKPNLMDNFKKLFNKNMDEEIDSLEDAPNMEQSALNGISGEEYNLDDNSLSQGGR